ncbi:hypothetical protein M514_23215 [Trichuris suis]|uniref:Uncharacterized protein n=1 Tax=Trichuris suis TaxID=68888 RepID=A0A085N567_9BILA|nr:hypothetical protein M514_23215 [Trichuris suis]
MWLSFRPDLWLSSARILLLLSAGFDYSEKPFYVTNQPGSLSSRTLTPRGPLTFLFLSEQVSNCNESSFNQAQRWESGKKLFPQQPISEAEVVLFVASVIATNPHSTKHNDGKANGSTTQPGIFMTRILLNRFMKTACINAGMVAFVLITLKSSHIRFKFI